MAIMLEPKLPQIAQNYMLTIFAYWWALLPGVVMPLPDIYKWLHPRHKELVIPHWVRLASVIFALFFAQFLAYGNSARNLAIVIGEKRQFSIKINELNARLQEDEQKIAELARKVTQSAGVKDPQNSLRRRTVRLADESEGFQTNRYFKRQALLVSLPAQTAEQETIRNQRLRDFDIETYEEYVKTGLRERTIGIIQELKSKGLDIGYLDAPGAAQSRLLMKQEIDLLRNLAYRLDANGNLVRF